MIETRNLTKRYGATLAVDRLSFTVHPGTVTGFLGPNGSGKSTTMRMITGLDAPDDGQARIGGRAYRELRWPLREVGALIGAGSHRAGQFLPELIAANSLSAVRPVPDFTLSPWAGLGIVALYAVIILSVGCWCLVRRDA